MKWVDGEIVDMGTTVATRSYRANAISDDKTVISGWQDDSDGTRYGFIG